MFQDKNLSKSFGGLWYESFLLAIKYGRWFGTKAKAVNICGVWSSPGVSKALYLQQLLQKSYSFSVPCCIWVQAVISWPKPCCQQTLQEDLSSASMKLHKSFHEKGKGRCIRRERESSVCSISSVCCSHKHCLKSCLHLSTCWGKRCTFVQPPIDMASLSPQKVWFGSHSKEAALCRLRFTGPSPLRVWGQECLW